MKNLMPLAVILLFIPSLQLYATTTAQPQQTSLWPNALQLFAPQNLNLLIGAATLIVVLLLSGLFYYQRRAAKTIALDSLTKLPTQHILNEQIPKLLKKAAKGKMPLSVITLDIDCFKNVNDALGHTLGDQVLQMVADILAQTKKDSDLLVRWAGDKFVIVSPGVNLKRACAIAEQMRENIASTFLQDPDLPDITISLGGAQYQPGETFEQLMARADKALHRAKKMGKNRVSCHIADTTYPEGRFTSPYRDYDAPSSR